MSEEEQAVAGETDTETQQSSVEGSSAQGDDLDSLLAEYEESKSGSNEPPKGESETSGDDDIKKWVRSRMEKEQREQTQNDINQAVETMKGSLPEDMPVDVPNELLEGYLYRMADKDKRFLNAFMNRHDEPDKWSRVLKSAASEFSRMFSVDKKATDDRNAVASAVRSASKAPATDGPNEKDIQSMSDAEFNRLKDQMLGR